MAVSVAVTAGCSSDSDRPTTLPTAPATTSTLPPPTTEPTTTVPSDSTTTSVAAAAPAASPEAYAQSLYDAWTRGDQVAAATVAQAEAVTTLFSRTWTADDGWVFAECSGAAGSLVCAWDRPSEQLLMRVLSGSGDQPVTVAEVRFV